MPNQGDLLIDRYRILERIGSGGMATVHRARDERLDRDVAIKVLLPNLAGDPLTAARFEREARSLAAASHPGVVAVFDVDAGDPATGREPFFVMELCPGGSLADRLAGGSRLAPDDLVSILVQVADGLADLHRRGVVHRDIKPQNILFAADRAKVADFGVAQSDDGTASSELTMPGTAVGTLAYLAPEILAGERATTAVDVYSLGVVAFVALTGQPPRPAGSMAELVTSSRSPAPRASAAAPDLGPAFDDPIARALAVRPEDRPDALSFASGLTAALGRWSRDGGPARRATGRVASAAASPAVIDASAPVTDLGDATTAFAIPLAPTAAVPVEHPAPVRPAPDGSGSRQPRTSRTLVLAASIASVALVTIAVLGAFSPRAPSPGPGASIVGKTSPSASLPAPAASPSIKATARATPAPTTDPAIAALDALGAAINAARGGPDGLKGKDANDLEERVAAVRRALDGGDRA